MDILKCSLWYLILILLWCGRGNVIPHSNYLIFPNGNDPLSYGECKVHTLTQNALGHQYSMGLSSIKCGYAWHDQMSYYINMGTTHFYIGMNVIIYAHLKIFVIFCWFFCVTIWRIHHHSSLIIPKCEKKVQKHNKRAHVPIIRGLHFLLFFLSYLSLSLLVWTWKFVTTTSTKTTMAKTTITTTTIRTWSSNQMGCCQW